MVGGIHLLKSGYRHVAITLIITPSCSSWQLVVLSVRGPYNLADYGEALSGGPLASPDATAFGAVLSNYNLI